MMRLRALLVAGLLVTGACGSSDTTGPGPDPDITMTTFAPALGIDLSKMTKTASGLYFRDLTVGTGATVLVGKRVSIHYIGWLSSGAQFDANQPGSNPFQFTVGTGQVIPGFDQGVRGMAIGGRRQLIIPPSLGYGSTASGLIPANSILVFQIDLIAIQ